jgi:hypothetical protein
VSEALIEEGGVDAWLAMGLAAEQFIGEFGHTGLANPELMEGAAEAPRQLWMWHLFEAVEHLAALHDGWVAVFGEDRAARDIRVLGAAYTLIVLALIWPAASYALFSQHTTVSRNRWSTWKPALVNLFGRKGLIRGAVRNLTMLAKVGFHPFDCHDPKPMLDEHREALTDPSWERAVKPSKNHGSRAGQVGPPELGWRDIAGLMRFTVTTSRYALRFLGEARAHAAERAQAET